MSKPKIALLQTRTLTEQLFTEEALARIGELGRVTINPGRERPTVEETIQLIEGAQACVTSWGCQPMTDQILDAAPDLGIIVYAAGSVKPIVTDAVWERGITVTSGAAVIAIDVAETALAWTICSLKRFWQIPTYTRQGLWREPEVGIDRVRETYGLTIGVIGAGHVGRNYIRLVRNLGIEEVLLYDPYCTAEQAAELGATKVELEELLRRSDVVSVHAPALPSTRHMLNADNLALMKDDAVLLNTSRGQNIDEEALIAELEKGRLFACLDVTDPEPPAADSRLRSLPNVVLTPHIAGSVNNGRKRLGDHAVEELRRFFAGEPPLHQVTREMLDRIA